MPNFQDTQMDESQERWIWIIQEMLLEFIARLGVGIIFLVSAALVLNESFSLVSIQLLYYADYSSAYLIVYSLFLAYIVGLILSRLNIKTPDRLGFQRRAKCLYWDLLREKDKKDSKTKYNLSSRRVYILKMRLCRAKQVIWSYLIMKVFDEYPSDEFDDSEFKQWLIREFACTSKADCEFPYLYLRDYLETRGLYHLSELVHWGGKGDLGEKKRTKNYIDLLKIRIRFYGGSRVMHIIRNEANVRSLSSMWWAARIITWISVFAFFIPVVVNSEISFFPMSISVWFPDFKLNVITEIVFFSALLVRWGITNYIHDLRIREVVHVLGTVHMLQDVYPQVFDIESILPVRKGAG